jgi:NAD+ synthase
MQTQTGFSTDVLKLDPAREFHTLKDAIREIVFHKLHKKGVVVALSGGVDSSVTLALCAEALGKERVFGLMMPEYDSASESTQLGQLVADHFGIKAVVEDITPILQAMGCYERRDCSIRQVIPEYGPNWKSKIVLPNMLDSDGYPIYSVVAISPDGEEFRARLTAEAYLGVVAATNFKQRTRKMLEYYHADRLQYAVAGTPNRLEYDLGFFVKLGDGAADFKPIAHLYKSQVYQLAEFLGIPEEIRRRPSSTDTYSMQQSQEEFYFSLPLAKMDLCLYGRDHEVPAEEVGAVIDLLPEQVERVYRQIDGKRKATRYLHFCSFLVEDVQMPDKGEKIYA